MNRKRMAFIGLILLCLVGISVWFITQAKTHEKSQNTTIKDDISQLDNIALERIALSYFNIFGFKTYFTKDDLLDYEKAYEYMKYAGVYRLNHLNIWEMPELMSYHDEKTATLTLPAEVVDKLIFENKIERWELAECVTVDGAYIIDDFFWEVRPELHHYFNKDNWEVTIPAEMVDKYILGKFNTKIDHLKISEYNKASDTYTFEPFLGEFYYDLLIDQVTTEGSLTRFSCSATLSPNVQETPSITYQGVFTVELINGEYKYISVEIS